MDRDRNAFAARPNARPASKLVVKDQGRKPLFASTSSRGDSDAKDKDADRAQPNTGRYRASGTTDAQSRRSLSDSQTTAPERRGSNSSLASPGSTRIPKPKGSSFSSRKPLSLVEAWELADEDVSKDDEDVSLAADGSPSPAPRPWRARREEEDRKMRKILGEDHLDSKAKNRLSSRDSVVSISPEKNESPRRRNAYGRSRIGMGSREAAQEDKSNEARPENRGEDLGEKPRSGLEWFKRLGSKDDLTGEGRIPALAPGIEDLPFPSVESGARQQDSSAPDSWRVSTNVNNRSPEKSFAWQVDQDFTAGDLQVSDSPRIRMDNRRPFANRLNFDGGSELDINSPARIANPGSQNRKIDEIYSREKKAGSNLPVERPRPRQPNRKLDEILGREHEVEQQIPIPDPNHRPKNTKLPEIERLEIHDGISKRELAAMRLAEIREQNAVSRSLSPEEHKALTNRRTMGRSKPSVDSETKEPARPKPAFEARETKEPARSQPISELRETKEPVRPKSAFEAGGERIPDTPVTIYKSRRGNSGEKNEEEQKPRREEKLDDGARPGILHTRNDSQDLLRRLARATSSSPLPETEAKLPPVLSKIEKMASESSDAKSGSSSRRSLHDTKKNMQREMKDTQHTKPTVEFVGLPRTSSTDSVKSKRSSLHSETDPTDRIEGEMSLFEPADNHSEKGSIRAPSPWVDSEEEKDVDATPKPLKPDPLTMPTPKITGAYVDTPATVKTVKMDPKEERPARPKSSATNRDKKTEFAWRSRDQDTASDLGTDEKATAITASSGPRRRRARSLPWRKGPLRNSGKLPSVRDDLLELQNLHNIEDSTLDDFAETLMARENAALLKAERRRKNHTEDMASTDDDNASGDDSHSDSLTFNLDLDTKKNTKSNKNERAGRAAKDRDYYSDGESTTDIRMRRMSKRLETGLSGIRDAKKGIERLQDQVLHAEKNHSHAETKTSHEEIKSLNKMHSAPQKTSSAPHDHDHGLCTRNLTIPLPRLYHRTPVFRFTTIGLLLSLLLAWYAAETTMCALFCRPTTCGSSTCVWSFDDPTFGTALPIKLDQWTTGGHGRALTTSLLDDLSDWAADTTDAMRGRDIADVDTASLTFQQKRQHHRRLQKKGLLKPRPEPTPQQRAKWEAWRAARKAKERVQEAREMGYEMDSEEEESVGRDERVW
ncbi:hypothetical protein G7046_g9529 [Stylonectria norvegica]|nr:hypothetical protein G7046_g9529 [Stylonectria norvegica]